MEQKEHWPKRLWRLIVVWFHVSNRRKEQISEEIRVGSDPRFNYYLLLLLSALITTFGMIANSPAVVIGAMLVCPLMMPIFGISLGMVMGDARLLRGSIVAEAGGVVLVIGAAWLVGISPFSFEMTTEILNNTSPNLLDLFVAAMAGFAVCMAMIDERISPSLPGIAVSISLTPPLAACGLCWAFGAYEGGAGAFILFLANFLTILFVSGITFIAAGFVRGSFRQHRIAFIRRFAPAAITMIFIVIFLTHAMLRLIENKRIVSDVRRAIQSELSDVQNLEVREITLDRSNDGKEWNALVVMDAAKEPTPQRLQVIEDRLQRKLHKTVNVFVQTRITRNVSASQDKVIRFYRSADGIESVNSPVKDVSILNVASQIVRERMERVPGMLVTDIELRHAPNDMKVVYTTIQGPIRPFPGGIKEVEERVQAALHDKKIRLVARYVETCEVAADGFSPAELGGDGSKPANIIQSQAAAQIRAMTGLTPQAIKAKWSERHWIVVAEVNGPTVMTPGQAHNIQNRLQELSGQKVSFMAFSKAETMVCGDNSDTAAGH